MKPDSLVMAFDSTHEAIAFEAAAQALGASGRLIPLPQAISAGCGLAWLLAESPERFSEKGGSVLRQVLSESGASGVLYRLVGIHPDRFEAVEWS